MNRWLVKCEYDTCTFDQIKDRPDSTGRWRGVRNYQARNFMRDAMRVGDGVLFHHSGCAEPGIAGVAEVASAPVPDPSQFDPASRYFDPGSAPDSPRWIMVNVRALRKSRLVSLAELRSHAELAEMVVLRRGNRLSITPVTAAQWRFITERLIPPE